MSTRIEIAICLTLAIVFGVVSYCAVITKFPTYDEPSHFGSGYASWFFDDYRINPENPTLWEWWPLIPIPRGAMHVDPSDPAWKHAGELQPAQLWETSALFQENPQRGIAMINRGRFMMMLLGVTILLLVAWWAHEIAGPWAG